jgi:UDP-N-acetylmuramate-alanine ligase
MFRKYQHIHFVGIGGIDGGIAEVLHAGYRVSDRTSESKRRGV